MGYKTILQNYISSVDATNGSIVFQSCDGLVELCETENTRQNLLDLVNRSTISEFSTTQDSSYQDLINWSRNDILLESSEGLLFCLPQNDVDRIAS